jgi:long-chain acyl-CoA synthetase
MTYPTATLPQLLEQTAAKSARDTALIYFDTTISYEQLQDQVNRLAAGLQTLGVEKGDRVALLMPNCPQFVISYFGALRAGAIVTATSSMYTAREVTHQWNDAGVKIVIADRRLFPVIRTALPQLASAPQIVLTGMRQYYPQGFRRLCASLDSSTDRSSSKASESDSRGPARTTGSAIHGWEEILGLSRTPRPDGLTPSDIACLQYTGGTTGTSKGAMLTHANLVINARQATDWLTLGKGGAEVMVAALPLFHIYAMTCVMNASVLGGGSVVILPRFELRAALNVIRKYHPTLFHGVPTMYVAFNNAPHVDQYGFNSLRVCMSGGAPLPVEVREKFETLTGGRLVEGYGLTETSPVTHINPPTGSPKMGSIGLPIPDTEARIVDLETGLRELPVGEIGEIAIRGPQVMKGYWNKPEETALVLHDGWLYTGDLARKDTDGYYYIVDRKKDIIIAGGYNIYPREVEEVLWEFPKILEAAVIGVPDSYRGETVKAFVVLQPGTAATADEIIAFCRERLAAYKVPRQVVFRDSLPKSGVGKYLRRALRNL